MRPQDLTDTQRSDVQTKVDSVAAILKELFGAEMDVVLLAHAQHGPDEPCAGAFVLASENVSIMKIYEMLAQGMILTEGTLIKQSIESKIPPGTKLQ